MRKAILYIRVSTDEQADRGFSLRDQKQKLLNYAKHNDIEVLEVFEEDYSAKTFDRPVYKKLLAYLKTNKRLIDELLFVKWDRFSRNAGESYQQISNLRKMNVNPNAIEQPLDLLVPEQRLMLALYLAAPEVENERKSLNVTAGMRRSAKEGRYVGGTPRGYKSIRDEKGKPFLTPNDDSKFIKEAFQLYSTSRYSQREVRDKLQEKGFSISKAQFAVTMKNPLYKGYVRLKKYQKEEEELVRGIHKSLVSEQTWEKVQDIISGRFGDKKPYTTKSIEKFPLRGFVECHKCGNVLTASTSRGNGGLYEYYHCSNGCKNNNAASKVHNDIERVLKGFSADEEVRELYLKIVKEELKEATKSERSGAVENKAQMNKLKTKIQKVQDLYIDGELAKEDYKQIMLRYKSELVELSERKDIKNKDISELLELLSWGFGFADTIAETYANTTVEGKKLIIGSIFPKKFTFENERVRTNEIGKVFSLIACESMGYRRLKKKDKLEKSNLSCVVIPPRLELELSVPKTEVLPLHHGTNLAANLLNFLCLQNFIENF